MARTLNIPHLLSARLRKIQVMVIPTNPPGTTAELLMKMVTLNNPIAASKKPLIRRYVCEDLAIFLPAPPTNILCKISSTNGIRRGQHSLQRKKKHCIPCLRHSRNRYYQPDLISDTLLLEPVGILAPFRQLGLGRLHGLPLSERAGGP